MKLFGSSSHKFTLQHGFTLIELIVVMGVLGTLITGLVLVINPAGQMARARDAERKSDLAQIQKSLEIYYDDYGEYPPTVNNEINDIDWGGSWSPYIQVLPADPISPAQKYIYRTASARQIFRLYTHLESTTDAQKCPGASGADNCPNAPANACGTSGATRTCNYGVTSPNTSP